MTDSHNRTPIGDPQWGQSTRSVHQVIPPPPAQRPLATPVYRSAAWEFDTAQSYADVMAGREPGYSYSRIDNPTVDAFAASVALLEGAEAGQGFGSGMGAISTVLMTLLSAGDHVVASAQLYGGTYALLTHVLPRFGVLVDFVDLGNLDAVAAALRPQTRVVYAETFANPTMAVADLPALSALCRDARARLVVDSTFASPAVCRPLEHGADVVVHSATKYLGGHADATGGVAVGPADLIAEIRAVRVNVGTVLAPDEAFLLARGLSTLRLRLERQCATALTFATRIAQHRAVERVDHPGLPDFPTYEVAVRLCDPGMYGAIVTVAPRGGRDAGMRLCDELRLIRTATSLGSVHSKVSHAASTTHRQLSDEALRAGRIEPSAVRFSLGLEDVDDLIADTEQALDRL
jgi:cystathionine beta-lyase/cystathionine gamma-synthase